MRNLKLTLLTTMIALGNLSAQQQTENLQKISLYVSKATGQFSIHKGSGSKTTDKYESGKVTVRTEGPIGYNVNPAGMSIGPLQSKTWAGEVWADIAKCPPPGKSISGKLIADYDVVFSRPLGSNSGGTQLSTYWCGPGSIPDNDGCTWHGFKNGEHEIVNKTGSIVQEIEVYSISCNIPDTTTCSDGTITLHADLFPGHMGSLVWDIAGQKVSGNNIQIKFPPGMKDMKVTATYSVGGVSTTCTNTIKANKMIGFKLPCCVSTQGAQKDKNTNMGFIPTASIAEVEFDGPCHPPVTFDPATLNNWTLIPPLPGQVAPNPTQVPVKTYNPVTATCGDVTLTSGTTVVGENNTWSPMNFGLNTFILRCQEQFKDVLNKLDDAGGFSPCGPLPNNSINVNFVVSEGKICCPKENNCVKDARKFEGGASFSYGVKCHFPIAGVPYVASLDAVVSASLGMAFNVNYTTGCTVGKFCIDPTVTVSIGGGIGFTVAAGAIQGDLQLVIEASAAANLCLYPPPASAKYTINLGKVKVVGCISTLYVFNYCMDYTVFEGWTWGPNDIAF